MYTYTVPTLGYEQRDDTAELALHSIVRIKVITVFRYRTRALFHTVHNLTRKLGQIPSAAEEIDHSAAVLQARDSSPSFRTLLASTSMSTSTST